MGSIPLGSSAGEGEGEGPAGTTQTSDSLARPDQGAQAQGWHCKSPRGPSRAYESRVRAVPAGEPHPHLPRSRQIFVIINLLSHAKKKVTKVSPRPGIEPGPST